MTNRLACGLFAVTGVVVAMAIISTANGSPAKGPPKRVKMDCGGYRAGAESALQGVGAPAKLKAGDWGAIPAALRALPPKSEACCSPDPSTVVIISALFGKDVETHYAPLFEKMGCKPLVCDINERKTSCKCKGAGKVGSVETDSDMEAYFVTFIGR